MSSTAIFNKVVEESRPEFCFKLPLKKVFAKEFYGHPEGSSNRVLVGPEHRDWLRGVYDCYREVYGSDADTDAKDLLSMLEIIEHGGKLELWFEW